MTVPHRDRFSATPHPTVFIVNVEAVPGEGGE